MAKLIHMIVRNSLVILIFLFQRKCDQYWPKAKEETETYGYVEVTLESEEIMANYTVRIMKIKHLKVRQVVLEYNCLYMHVNK